MKRGYLMNTKKVYKRQIFQWHIQVMGIRQEYFL